MSLFSEPGQQRYSGQLHSLQITEAVYATAMPIVIGTQRTHMKLMFYGGFTSQNAPAGGKGFGSGKNQEWVYYADVLAALASASATDAPKGILNIWDQAGMLANESGNYSYLVPPGGGSVTPSNSPAIQQDLGVTKAQAYSLSVTDFGSGQTRTLTGTQQVPMQRVTGTPSAGQYSFDESTSTYTFAVGDAGATVAINYSTAFSLYYYQSTQAAEVPTSSPYQISTDNQEYFYQNVRVVNVKTGAALNNGTDYTEHDGVYTFNSSLAGVYVYITYTWTSNDPNISNSSSLNVTFFNGVQGQSPWSYMSSKYPGQAFGYPTICYMGCNPMYLGESPTMPSYNMEVVGICLFPGQLDADATVAIQTVLSDPFLGVSFPSSAIGSMALLQAYWAAAGFFISEAINDTKTCSQLISRWVEAGNANAFFSDGQLKFVPYGDTTIVGNGYTYTPPGSVLTLTWDDILPMEGAAGHSMTQDPIQYSVRQPQDCYNYVQVQWTNRLNSYNTDLITEQNDAAIASYRLRMEPPQMWDFLTTAAAATWALRLRLNRYQYIIETGKVKLPFTHDYLDPMDIVILPTGEVIRITQIDESESGELTISFEQFNYGSGDVTVYTKQAPTSYQPNQSQALPGDSVPIFVQDVTMHTAGQLNLLKIAASGQSANWGGCNVYVSTDGTTYTNIGPVKDPSLIGILTAELPVGGDPDTTNTLAVDITLSTLANASAELVSVTASQLNNFVTLCAIVDPTGEATELVAYETATMTAQDRYNLTNLRRGAYNTPILDHVAGSWFAFLGPGFNFLEYQYPMGLAGQTIYIKLQSFNLAGNQLQDLANCKVWPVTLLPTSTAFIESFVPSAYTISGTGTVSNPEYAYDKNFKTSTIINCGEVQNSTVTYSGFPAVVINSPCTLFTQISWSPGTTEGPSASVNYSLNGGVTWQVGEAIPESGPSFEAIISMPLVAGTALANVQLQFVVTSPGLGDGGMLVYEVWIQ